MMTTKAGRADTSTDNFSLGMKGSSDNWRSVIATTLRLLLFRSSREELLHLGGKHLALGLFCTWLVGMGRYWDNPRASLLQHLGLGSIIYIFVLARLLWTFARPLKPKDWTYFRVLTFVSLVSPPAIIYPIPLERVFDLSFSNVINAWFLAMVAACRFSLSCCLFPSFFAT
jgi:hypothetical protein